jgi:hypothetical protein
LAQHQNFGVKHIVPGLCGGTWAIASGVCTSDAPNRMTARYRRIFVMTSPAYQFDIGGFKYNVCRVVLESL